MQDQLKIKTLFLKLFIQHTIYCKLTKLYTQYYLNIGGEWCPQLIDQPSYIYIVITIAGTREEANVSAWVSEKK